MRVIGGEFRSRRLKSPPGLDTRPTPDRLRESLFNVLAPWIQGAVFVDAYAGCGSVGIEALSRGAAQTIFIERNRANVVIIRENLASLNAADRARVIRGGAATYLPALRADIYFVDPPYDRPAEYEAALGAVEAGEGAVVIAQHASRQQLEPAYGPLIRYRTIRQGDNSLSFYKTGGASATIEDGSPTTENP
jgi:16S rRNA (guanine(966)-N(2))-methyltransferase RsmD